MVRLLAAAVLAAIPVVDGHALNASKETVAAFVKFQLEKAQTQLADVEARLKKTKDRTERAPLLKEQKVLKRAVSAFRRNRAKLLRVPLNHLNVGDIEFIDGRITDERVKVVDVNPDGSLIGSASYRVRAGAGSQFRPKSGVFWITGLDTKNLTDSDAILLRGIFTCTGTKSYKTVSGAMRIAKVIKPWVPKKKADDEESDVPERFRR